MSSLFNHIFIPLAILFIFSNRLKLDPKKIIILSFFGILPDMDIFLFHRASFHNIFVLLIPLLIFIIIKNRRDISGIICFYMISHVILDAFNGGAFLLYPFYHKVFFVNIEVIFNHGSITHILDYGISRRIVSNGIDEPMISSENIGVAILLMIFALVQSQYKTK